MNNYNFKPFDKVLVREDNKSVWCCDFYSHKNITTSGREYHEIIPYEGNEHLLGTTDAPKPKRWRAEDNCEYYHINSNGIVHEGLEINVPIDDEFYNIGNYFRTKEEAQAMADKFKTILKGE